LRLFPRGREKDPPPNGERGYGRGVNYGKKKEFCFRCEEGNSSKGGTERELKPVNRQHRKAQTVGFLRREKGKNPS